VRRQSNHWHPKYSNFDHIFPGIARTWQRRRRDPNYAEEVVINNDKKTAKSENYYNVERGELASGT
jgi:hypothetical protein